MSVRNQIFKVFSARGILTQTLDPSASKKKKKMSRTSAGENEL